MWPTVTVEVPEELKDAVVGEFSADRIAGVWERPSKTGGVELVLYFEGDHLPPLIQARIGRIFERNGYQAPGHLAVGIQKAEDWTLQWRKSYTRFPVGGRFQVVPSWEEPDPSEGRITLSIDPGMAFGTGTHETTQMVLEALEALAGEDRPVLDLGTGSGILAIASAHLGFSSVDACDSDANAVRVARENVERNGAAVRLFTGSVDAVAPAAFGIVLANLTADVIEALMHEIRCALGPGGRAVFSGILGTQAARIRDRIAVLGLALEREWMRGEWIALQIRKDGD